MKKRLRKKAGNRYNVLKRAQRAKLKRRGYKCIDYALVPIGIEDQLALDFEGYTPEYPYATHWLIQLAYMKDKFPIKNIPTYDSVHYIITVFPCNERGGTHTEATIYLRFFTATTPDKIRAIFNNQVALMKKDGFWQNRD